METVRHFGWRQLNNGRAFSKKERTTRSFIELPYTIYVSGMPSRKQVLDMMNDVATNGSKNKILLGIGVARLHPDDEYVRKKGAEIAKKNEKFSSLDIKGFNVYEDGTVSVKIESSDYWIDVQYVKTGGAKITYFKEMT